MQGNASSWRTMKQLMDPEDIKLPAASPLHFEQAHASVPILSVYEAQKIQEKSFLQRKKDAYKWDISEAVDPGFAPVQVMKNLSQSTRTLCHLDIDSPSGEPISTFLNEALQDTRLRIARASPEYEVPVALDRWTDPLTQFATAGSSDSGFEIVPQISAFPSTRNRLILPCHFFPVPRNKNFFNRTDVLQALEKEFFSSPQGWSDEESSQSGGHDPRTFAICGPGGMGKTQVAAEFTHLNKDRFDAIFWIYANEEAKVAESFSQIALKLGLLSPNSVDARDKAITRGLAMGWLADPVKYVDPSDERPTDQANWLLVFDNVDNPEVLEDYWPIDGPGCVLFTSRDPLAKNSPYLARNGVDLQPFSTDEGSEFLCKLTRKYGDSSGVTQRLCGIPLALTQMAGVIIRHDLTFDEFSKTYDEEESREALLQLQYSRPKLRVDYEHTTIASVWALESLKHGRTLLEVLSFLDPDEIHEVILTTHADVVSLANFPKASSAYQTARTELLQCSLISRDKAAEKIQVHRLIQDTTRAKLNEKEFKAVFSAALTLISSVWPHQSFSWRHGVARWRVCEQLFPHIRKLKCHAARLAYAYETLEADFELAKLLTDAGWHYHECGNSIDSVPYFDMAQSIVEKLRHSLDTQLMSDSKRSQTIKRLDTILAEIHHNSGCVGTETNDPAGTLKHFKIFNEMMMREIGDGSQGQDVRLAISWNELGIAYMMNAMWEKGEECFKRSMSTVKMVDNWSWIDMSLPFVNLGYAYLLMGKLEDAEATLLKGLGHREAEYGVDDKNSFITGRFLHALGNVKTAQGRFAEGFSYHTRSLSQYLSTIGGNHHRTGDVYVKIAEHHSRFDQQEQALENLDLALKIFTPRAILRLETARAKFRRSRVLRALNRFDEARKDHEASVELYLQLGVGGKQRAEDLTDDDFDAIIAFWSR